MFNDPRIFPSCASFYLLAAAAIGAPLLTGCGSGISAAGAFETLATAGSGTTSSSTPAALSNISPGAVMAGTRGALVNLQGGSINANATVLMDGAAHAADFVSSSEIHVPLTAAELAVSERHAFTVQNPQTAVSGVKTLLVSSWYNAFGDSITAGFNLGSPSTQNYSALLAATLNLTETNNAFGGDQACDVFPRQIYGSGTGYTSQPAPLQSLMIGTNDVDTYDAGPYEAIFNTCHQAALAWLGTPRSSRSMAGDDSLAVTGGCINAPSAADYGGLACTAAGTITTTLTTGGNAIYIWYTLSDTANPASAFQVSLDGAASGTYTTLPALPLSTRNGGHGSVALIRLTAAGGLHTVNIRTATGGIGIQGVGTNPSSGRDLPRVLATDLPNQFVAAPLASVSAQLAYSADIAANVSLLASDGIDVRLAPTRKYMLGTLAEMHDTLHPNLLGNQHLEAALLSVLP